MSTRQSALLSGRPDIHLGGAILDGEDWDFAGEDTQYLLHDLHPYPARFIPQIPRRAIERWSRPRDRVLDPFCGSGTTLLECRLNGRDSIGVDNNGVATLLASVKVSDFSDESLRGLESAARDVVRLAESEKGPPRSRLDRNAWVPSYASLSKWFDARAIAELAWLKQRLEELTPDAKMLGLAVLSSIVVRVSRQDSDTRYVATDREFQPGSAMRLWGIRARRAVGAARATAELSKPSHHSIYTRDSRQLPELADATIDLIVTSPPYLNAYDYHKYHRHRLEWIAADISLARDVEVGKHDTFTRNGATPDRYFEDLGACMKEWQRVLRPGSHAFVVVSDAIVSSHFVPVAERLIEVGRSLDLPLERRWLRNVDVSRKSFNRAARIKREHLLLFRKSE